MNKRSDLQSFVISSVPVIIRNKWFALDKTETFASYLNRTVQKKKNNSVLNGRNDHKGNKIKYFLKN